MEIPSGYSLQSLEKDAVTLVADATHSVQQPHLVIIDRRIPVFGPSGNLSQPTYRIRVIRGNVEGEDDTPIAQRTLSELTLRWMPGEDSAHVEDMIVDPLQALLGLTGFASDVFSKQNLPTIPASV